MRENVQVLKQNLATLDKQQVFGMICLELAAEILLFNLVRSWFKIANRE